MIKAILFDLDGTLLPMDEEEFTKGYFKLLCLKLSTHGYESDKLIKTVWSGTKLMIKNDGTKTNVQVFWDCFSEVYGKEKLCDLSVFNDFYVNEFKKTKLFCGENEYAVKLVQTAKKAGFKTILASNPVFPKCGMITRMNFIDLCESDFDYISNYSDSHYSKPNPDFYREILNANGLKPEETIYFCNSLTEDVIPAEKCGIKTCLIGDCVTLNGCATEKTPPIYSYPEAIELISSLTNQTKLS